ncbi:MAG: LacI family transcriptional regulator [Chloroflexi bacterium]|nr:LacI family transcriptional regulator [Chloroflexota bacterium]MCI0647173.1 LacI family transcriptional regulator [Chloroflexota bacterium]MCI0729951.1 LacI family transcriptional regulator [Chloroflexota bacterium]
MANKVTIATIAESCRVSPTTVSLVLNGKPGVSHETRALVLDTARKAGYLPPYHSTSQKAGRLTTVGMMVKSEPGLLPPANPFYSQIIAGVDDACQDMGINLLFAMLPVDENNHPVNVPPLMENSSVDGLLMVGTFIDRTIHTILRQRTLPIVLVDGYSDTESYDMVVSDNFRAAYQAVEYLIKNGHGHIGLVGSEPGCYPSLWERRNGYLRALKENGMTQSYIANFNVNASQGEEETAQLLTENPQLSALFCVNDNVALGALRAAQRLNRQVPQDLSVVGYDDTYLATSISPTLTTMRVDTLAMGRAAVHLLALRMEKPDAARSTFIIHPELVERESTDGRR